MVLCKFWVMVVVGAKNISPYVRSNVCPTIIPTYTPTDRQMFNTYGRVLGEKCFAPTCVPMYVQRLSQRTPQRMDKCSIRMVVIWAKNISPLRAFQCMFVRLFHCTSQRMAKCSIRMVVIWAKYYSPTRAFQCMFVRLSHRTPQRMDKCSIRTVVIWAKYYSPTRAFPVYQQR